MKTRIIKKLFAGIAFCVTASAGFSQQDAMFTHYMYNTLAVNPAYAGSRQALTATALHRSQWVGFGGAPQTQTFTMHTPISGEHIGVGLSVVNDRLGPVKTTGAYADFAYHLKFSKNSHLAFGLKGGMQFTNVDLASLETITAGDVAFSSSLSGKALANFGAGIYYYSKRFYAGISTPKVVQNSVLTGTGNVQSYLVNENRHYFLIAGTMIDINHELQLKPTTLVKVTEGAPVEADLTATFIYDKKISLGAMYRTGDAAGLLAGFNVNEQFNIGYSYDWSFANKTGRYNRGTHEIMLRYDLIFKTEKTIKSPRFF